jgi:hypothetical protein
MRSVFCGTYKFCLRDDQFLIQRADLKSKHEFMQSKASITVIRTEFKIVR